MTVSAGREERHAIPRWRSLLDTLASREFVSEAVTELSADALASLARAEVEWAQYGGISRASELVGCALTAGVPERSRNAAQFLSRHAKSAAAKRIAAAALAPRSVGQLQLLALPDSVDDNAAREIARLKGVTKADPRNAIAWLELGRRYTASGQIDHARRCMTIAVGLAPRNRFIVRSAVAFFSHTEQPDRASAVVRHHPGLRGDPWLLAADLAATGEAGAKQLNVRQARQLLESGRFSSLAVSELASELATLEFGSASRKVKRLLSAAMVDPTENAAAQAEWVVRHNPQLRTWSDSDVAAGEAAARHAERNRVWTVARSNAELWLSDQPFSIDAATFASYAAAISEDFVRAAQLAEVGLRANPDSPLLINNLAYALVEIDQLDEADRQLARLEPSSFSGEDGAALLATSGLLAIRRGDWIPGVARYRQSIEMARKGGHRAVEAQAWLMLAREAIGTGEPADDAVDRAIASARGVSEPAVQELLQRLLRQRGAR